MGSLNITCILVYFFCHMPQFCKILLSYFDFIPRHYVKFNAKIETDDSVESKDVECDSEYFIFK